MFSWIRISSVLLLFAALLVLPSHAQNSEQLEVGPPPLHRADPPAPSATPEDLEQRGDELRAEKNFLDAIDYYQAALKGAPTNASLFNKIGICQLMIQRYKEAKKSFERSIRADHNHADAYNNLGVVYYEEKRYGPAVKQYHRAIGIDNTSASFYNNLGAALFSKKEFEPAVQAYQHAVELDPDVFERSSRGGVQAQLPSPDDRAHYDYTVAKLYAKMGLSDRSLEYLRKAMEQGYKGFGNVYKDVEFAELRKDKRFADLVATKPLVIE